MYLQTGNESEWLRVERRRIEDLASTSIDKPTEVDETAALQGAGKLSPRGARQAVMRGIEAIARRFAADRPYSTQT